METSFAVAPVRPTKKEIRKSLQDNLVKTLADYRPLIGEKKFDSRIRKVAKQLGSDISKALPKKDKSAKKEF